MKFLLIIILLSTTTKVRAAKTAGPVSLSVTCSKPPVIYSMMTVGSTEDLGFKKVSSMTYVFQNGNSELNLTNNICANALGQLKKKEAIP